jgi:hypothetical protein
MGCAALWLAACAKKDAGPPPPASDQPPHGGTPVMLGHEVYCLELVLDAEEGKMTGYVLDSEMEEFIRAGTPRFEIVAKVNGRDETLDFQPVANLATGETLTATSQYEAKADWLKTTKEFDATLKDIKVRGTEFSDVKFSFPKGNDTD